MPKITKTTTELVEARPGMRVRHIDCHTASGRLINVLVGWEPVLAVLWDNPTGDIQATVGDDEWFATFEVVE